MRFLFGNAIYHRTRQNGPSHNNLGPSIILIGGHCSLMNTTTTTTTTICRSKLRHNSSTSIVANHDRQSRRIGPDCCGSQQPTANSQQGPQRHCQRQRHFTGCTWRVEKSNCKSVMIFSLVDSCCCCSTTYMCIYGIK